MRDRFRYLVTAAAVAASVTYGIIVGPYWAYDAIALAALSLVLVLYLAPRFDPFTALGGMMARRMTILTGRAPPLHARALAYEGEGRAPNSRILHFVRMANMRDAKFALRQSDGPFERNLLSRPGWQSLTDDELAEVAAGAVSAPSG